MSSDSNTQYPKDFQKDTIPMAAAKTKEEWDDGIDNCENPRQKREWKNLRSHNEDPVPQPATTSERHLRRGNTRKAKNRDDPATDQAQATDTTTTDRDAQDAKEGHEDEQQEQVKSTEHQEEAAPGAKSAAENAIERDQVYTDQASTDEGQVDDASDQANKEQSGNNEEQQLHKVRRSTRVAKKTTKVNNAGPVGTDERQRQANDTSNKTTKGQRGNDQEQGPPDVRRSARIAEKRPTVDNPAPSAPSTSTTTFTARASGIFGKFKKAAKGSKEKGTDRKDSKKGKLEKREDSALSNGAVRERGDRKDSETPMPERATTRPNPIAPVSREGDNQEGQKTSAVIAKDSANARPRPFRGPRARRWKSAAKPSSTEAEQTQAPLVPHDDNSSQASTHAASPSPPAPQTRNAQPMDLSTVPVGSLARRIAHYRKWFERPRAKQEAVWKRAFGRRGSSPS